MTDRTFYLVSRIAVGATYINNHAFTEKERAMSYAKAMADYYAKDTEDFDEPIGEWRVDEERPEYTIEVSRQGCKTIIIKVQDVMAY